MPVLSAKIGTAFEETDPTGCYLHIIKPDGVGGYVSYAISLENFQSLLQDQIDTNTALIGVKRSDLNKNATFDFALPAGVRIESFIIQHIDGTVNIDIGTTLGGSEIFTGFDFTEGIEDFSLKKTYADAQTIYVTRNSGTFNLFTIYSPNILS